MKIGNWLVLMLFGILLVGCSSETKSLKVSPSKIDFQNVNIGDYIEIEVEITNKFGKDVFISDISIIGNSDFQIMTGSATPINLIKNAIHKLTLRFTPTTNVPAVAMLNIIHDASTKPKTVDIQGMGVKVARIEIPVTNFDFGPILHQTTTYKDFDITNLGTSDLIISSFYFTGSGAALYTITAGGNTPVNIFPGTTHTFTVQFAPLTAALYPATLEISHNAINEASPSTITIEGEGVFTSPEFTLNNTSPWDFGLIATTFPSTQQLTIESNGTDDLTISSVTLLTGTAFSVSKIEDGNGNALTLPELVPIGNTIYVFIEFAPTTNTTFNDTLTITHDATNHATPLDISLTGEGRDEIVKTFDSVTKTKENWTIPAGVTMLRIETWGAEGGGTGWGTPGKGARMRGDFAVQPGDVLQIAVGEQGETGGKGGGGGGGTFVVSNSQPMIIAGAGGGCHYYDNGLDAKDGVITQTCTPHPSTGTGDTSGSGGGWNGDGANGDYSAQGGKGWANGLAGGLKHTHSASHWSNGDGGYGGGGGGCWAAGSAGGYNGGVSATSGGNQTPGGTGGGSINNGSNQSNTAGVQVGNGKVIITY